MEKSTLNAHTSTGIIIARNPSEVVVRSGIEQTKNVSLSKHDCKDKHFSAIKSALPC